MSRRPTVRQMLSYTHGLNRKNNVAPTVLPH
jgi:hypothetical protein